MGREIYLSFLSLQQYLIDIRNCWSFCCSVSVFVYLTDTMAQSRFTRASSHTCADGKPMLDTRTFVILLSICVNISTWGNEHAVVCSGVNRIAGECTQVCAKVDRRITKTDTGSEIKVHIITPNSKNLNFNGWWANHSQMDLLLSTRSKYCLSVLASFVHRKSMQYRVKLF